MYDSVKLHFAFLLFWQRNKGQFLNLSIIVLSVKTSLDHSIALFVFVPVLLHIFVHVFLHIFVLVLFKAPQHILLRLKGLEQMRANV